MDVHVVVAAGVVAREPAVVKAVGWSVLGWMIELESERKMIVADHLVLDIEVEVLCFAQADAELAAMERAA